MVSDKWEEVSFAFEGKQLPCQLIKYCGTVSSLYSQCQPEVAVLTFTAKSLEQAGKEVLKVTLFSSISGKLKTEKQINSLEDQ